MELIGHRGCADQSAYPENTVRAVEEAATHLPAVEVDVRRCGSGDLVVYHDAAVQVEGDTVSLDEVPYETLAEIALGPQGDSIPRLTDVVAAVPEQVTLQVELKESGLARDVVDAVDDSHGTWRVSSFLTEALAEFLALDADVPAGYLFRDDPHRNLEVAADLGCEVVHPHHRLCVETTVVREAKAAGFEVIAWNTNDPAVVAEMTELGVAGITADRWDLDSESR